MIIQWINSSMNIVNDESLVGLQISKGIGVVDDILVNFTSDTLMVYENTVWRISINSQSSQTFIV